MPRNHTLDSALKRINFLTRMVVSSLDKFIAKNYKGDTSPELSAIKDETKPIKKLRAFLKFQQMHRENSRLTIEALTKRVNELEEGTVGSPIDVPINEDDEDEAQEEVIKLSELMGYMADTVNDKPAVVVNFDDYYNDYHRKVTATGKEGKVRIVPEQREIKKAVDAYGTALVNASADLDIDLDGAIVNATDPVKRWFKQTVNGVECWAAEIPALKFETSPNYDWEVPGQVFGRKHSETVSIQDLHVDKYPLMYIDDPRKMEDGYWSSHIVEDGTHSVTLALLPRKPEGVVELSMRGNAFSCGDENADNASLCNGTIYGLMGEHGATTIGSGGQNRTGRSYRNLEIIAGHGLGFDIGSQTEAVAVKGRYCGGNLFNMYKGTQVILRRCGTSECNTQKNALGYHQAELIKIFGQNGCSDILIDHCFGYDHEATLVWLDWSVHTVVIDGTISRGGGKDVIQAELVHDVAVTNSDIKDYHPHDSYSANAFGPAAIHVLNSYRNRVEGNHVEGTGSPFSLHNWEPKRSENGLALPDQFCYDNVITGNTFIMEAVDYLYKHPEYGDVGWKQIGYLNNFESGRDRKGNLLISDEQATRLPDGRIARDILALNPMMTHTLVKAPRADRITGGTPFRAGDRTNVEAHDWADMMMGEGSSLIFT